MTPTVTESTVADLRRGDYIIYAGAPHRIVSLRRRTDEQATTLKLVSSLGTCFVTRPNADLFPRCIPAASTPTEEVTDMPTDYTPGMNTTGSVSDLDRRHVDAVSDAEFVIRKYTADPVSGTWDTTRWVDLDAAALRLAEANDLTAEAARQIVQRDIARLAKPGKAIGRLSLDLDASGSYPRLYSAGTAAVGCLDEYTEAEIQAAGIDPARPYDLKGEPGLPQACFGNLLRSSVNFEEGVREAFVTIYLPPFSLLRWDNYLGRFIWRSFDFSEGELTETVDEWMFTPVYTHIAWFRSSTAARAAMTALRTALVDFNRERQATEPDFWKLAEMQDERRPARPPREREKPVSFL